MILSNNWHGPTGDVPFINFHLSIIRSKLGTIFLLLTLQTNAVNPPSSGPGKIKYFLPHPVIIQGRILEYNMFSTIYYDHLLIDNLNMELSLITNIAQQPFKITLKPISRLVQLSYTIGTLWETIGRHTITQWAVNNNLSKPHIKQQVLTFPSLRTPPQMSSRDLKLRR